MIVAIILIGGNSGAMFVNDKKESETHPEIVKIKSKSKSPLVSLGSKRWFNKLNDNKKRKAIKSTKPVSSNAKAQSSIAEQSGKMHQEPAGTGYPVEQKVSLRAAKKRYNPTNSWNFEVASSNNVCK